MAALVVVLLGAVVILLVVLVVVVLVVWVVVVVKCWLLSCAASVWWVLTWVEGCGMLLIITTVIADLDKRIAPEQDAPSEA